MERKEYEMPEEYKRNLAHLNDFLETREEFRQKIKDGLAHGVQVSATDKAMVEENLREFDEKIDSLEQKLAAEYERYQAEQAKEAEVSEMIRKGWEAQKRLSIIIKHQKPHLLAGFTECLEPLTPGDREKFLDDVAILESTQLDAIFNGEV